MVVELPLNTKVGEDLGEEEERLARDVELFAYPVGTLVGEVVVGEVVVEVVVGTLVGEVVVGEVVGEG